ncbi:MAG: DUF3999 family protein [Rhodocyclaceae bacterium]|nr:DUF3999 family protein [Rhodocyclaceae bacterium]
MNHLPQWIFWLLAGTLSAGAAAADTPAPSEFAWRATLSVPTGAHAVRVTLPAEAMLRLQSPDARDIQVFNADGEALAFSVVRPAESTRAAVDQTRHYPALPLFSVTDGKRPTKGAVQVRVDQPSLRDSVWVHFGEAPNTADTPEAPANRLPSVLFDTRKDKQTITALTLQADFPANTLVHFLLESSSDLVRWTPVAVQGPLFRFDGSDAPSNNALALQQPLPLEDRYLRLRWDGQTGVHVQGMIGSIASSRTAQRIRAPLPAGIADGNDSLTWVLDFSTPLAALHLSSTRDNTLIPVHILGRNDAAQPWRTLAKTMVYRLGATGQESSNPAVALGGTSARWLRVQATNGMTLPTTGLQATVEFEPIQVALLASGKAPFELVAGRARSTAFAIDSSVLAAVMTGKLEDLPVATLTNVRVQTDKSSDGAIQRLLPVGTEQRSVMLWAVLLLGVLVLGGVAYSLMRQLSAKPVPASTRSGGGTSSNNLAD